MPLVSNKPLGRTVRDYAWALEAFQAVAGDKEVYTEDDVRAAVAELEKKYRPSSVSKIVDVCSRSIDGWPSDVKYVYSMMDVKQTVTPTEDIERMVKTVRSGALPDDFVTYMAMSTTYGLRPNELGAMMPGDVDLEHHTVFVRTSKHGVQRKHEIPPELTKFIKNVPRPLPKSTIESVYRRIEALSGLGHKLGHGWHSIRRALATELAMAGANPMIVKKFLRWKSHEMVERYTVYNTAMDREIFALHPFLKFWR